MKRATKARGSTDESFERRVVDILDTFAMRVIADARTRVLSAPATHDDHPVTESAGTNGMRPAGRTLKEATDEFQRKLVLEALEANAMGSRWNMVATARDLGIERGLLYRLVERLGLPRRPTRH